MLLAPVIRDVKRVGWTNVGLKVMKDAAIAFGRVAVAGAEAHEERTSELYFIAWSYVLYYTFSNHDNTRF